MIILYILLGVVLFILALLLVNIRVTVSYGEKTYVKIGALFFNFRLTGSKKQKSKNKKASTSTVKKGETKKKSLFSEFKDGLDFNDFLELLIKLIVRMVETSSGHLKVRIDSFGITVGGKYPDIAALKFGAVNTAVALFFEYLSSKTQLSPLENSNTFVRCDFDKERTEADVKLTAKIRIVHLLKFVIKFFFDFIKLKETKNNTSLKGNK